MARRRGKGRFESEEEDPMAGTSNLVDAMLVIAVGLLVFLVLAWNMQSVLFNENLTPEEKEQVMLDAIDNHVLEPTYTDQEDLDWLTQHHSRMKVIS